MAMNIIQLQDNLKNLSDQQLAQEMQMPSGSAPQFLVLSELNRRKQMRDDFQAQQASQNKTTVAQDVVTPAGMPQGVASDMAQSLAPQTDMANNTGIMSIPQGGEPQRMAGGGPVKKMFDGMMVGDDYGYTDPMGVYAGTTDTTPPDPLSTGSWWYDLTMDDAQKQQIIDTQNKVAAANAAAKPPATGAPVDLNRLTDLAPPPAKDTSTGGGGGGGKPSSYEQALRDAMAASAKKAQQDKWLAVAQMGLSLMSSAQPNVGMALGEAGAKGIEALQGARDTASAEKLQLEEGLYKLEQDRAAAAAAAARANAPGKPKPIDVGALTALDARIKGLSELMANLPEGAAKLQAATQLDNLLAQADYAYRAYMTQRGAGEGLASIPVNTEDPADAIDATQ